MKIHKTDINNLKVIKNFLRTTKDGKTKIPALHYLYADEQGNFMATDGNAMGIVRRTIPLVDAGYYELKGNTLVRLPDDIQEIEYPMHAVKPFLNELSPQMRELTDEYVASYTFCSIMSKLNGTWIDPAFFLQIPDGDYDIGRYKQFRDNVLGECPVVFQNETFTFVIMPIKHQKET